MNLTTLLGRNIIKQVQLSSSGSIVVPADVTLLHITLVGGGGGGAVASATSSVSLGGSSGSGFFRRRLIVTPGETINYSVGAGGAGTEDIWPTNAASGSAGGDTTFGSLTGNGGAGGLATTGGAILAPAGYPTTIATGAGSVNVCSGDVIYSACPSYFGTTAVVVSPYIEPFYSNKYLSASTSSGHSGILGVGGAYANLTGAGTAAGGDASGFGAGGGGGKTSYNNAAARASGGDGADGTIIIEYQSSSTIS